MITDKVLKALGCKKRLPNAWVLHARGYEFIFAWAKDPLINNGEKTWSLFLSEEDREKGIGHSVDHIGECFGMIADDFFVLGKVARSRQLLDILEGKEDD